MHGRGEAYNIIYTYIHTYIPFAFFKACSRSASRSARCTLTQRRTYRDRTSTGRKNTYGKRVRKSPLSIHGVLGRPDPTHTHTRANHTTMTKHDGQPCSRFQWQLLPINTASWNNYMQYLKQVFMSVRVDECVGSEGTSTRQATPNHTSGLQQRAGDNYLRRRGGFFSSVV